jgi:hypothetical protein
MTADEAQQLQEMYIEVERKKFKRNFESLRNALRESNGRALRDAAGLAQDRERRSSQPVNPHARTQWHGSEAELLLRQDMQQNLHLNRKELWQSRPE